MSEYLDYLRELLSPLGSIRTRRMFGGWGIYCNELFFAIVAEDRLYLKVDAVSEPEFRAAGCEPFVYTGQDKPVAMSYWSLPDEAFDSNEAMRPWAQQGYAAACRAADAKAAKPARKPKPKPKPKAKPESFHAKPGRQRR